MEPPVNLHKLGRGAEDSMPPSNHLWVGDLSVQTADSDLMELFNRFGAVDSVTTYTSRSYAFVHFRRVEDAMAAKEALQGVGLHGNRTKIDFARPARPCKNLWVGGISHSVSKEELEGEFGRFGKIEDVKFLRDRNTAMIEYSRMEDASQAIRCMSGKQIHGEQIRVDFFRSNPSRRDQWPNSHDVSDGTFSGTMVSSDSHSGAKRAHSQVDGQPSKVLWVGYPPTVQIDEQMLHNAMILFGEIEYIKSFAPKHYAFVRFRSVEEARHAKEGLQGRLFNDPRIIILYSNNEIAPGRDYGFGSGTRPDVVLGNPPFRPSQQNHPLLPNTVSMQDAPRPSPRQTSGSWNVQCQRDGKRSRIETAMPTNDLGPVIDGGPFVNVQGKGHLSPVPGKVTAAGPTPAPPHTDFLWRGIIAKGGTPICHARCLPIGRGLQTQLPEVVNCSARTGLEILAKHYGEDVGFDLVFFLPDSEDDFASYTEFLQYLNSNNRAGVAKFDDGTTLFLVPPEFLTKVLKVLGPERLYGIVFKSTPQVPSTAPLQPHPPLPSHPDYGHLKEEETLKMEHARVLHGDSIPPARPVMQSPQPNTASAQTQTGVALTPDLIATLASFLPTTSQSAAVGGVGPSLMTSATQSSFAQTIAPNGGGASAQIWNQEQQASKSAVPSFQHFNPSAQHYSTMSSTPAHGGTQYASSMPLANFNMASQLEHGAFSAPINHQYRPQVPQKGHGMMHAGDASRSYGAPILSQTSNLNVLTNQVHGATVSQPQNPMQAERKVPYLPSQVQAAQPVVSSGGQGTSDTEVDRNERYQSTLQFAANLLLQLQQQTNTPGGKGTGN